MDTSTTDASPAAPPIVLIVEDDVDTREMYHAALEFDGYWVVDASEVSEALLCAAEIVPDIIVTDIGLHGATDGVTFAQCLRADGRTAEIPILAVTGRDIHGLGAAASLFNAVLLKPVLPDDLSAKIRTSLARSAELRERSAAARDLSPTIISESQRLLSKAKTQIARTGEHVRTVRSCPQCGRDLRWSERRRVHGITFDYYAPCGGGCGLFCYNHSERRFLPLTDS
jgi:DNA-binding response OmpR family regulator